MKKHMKKLAIAIGASILPAVTFAQVQGSQSTYQVSNIAGLYNAALGLINGLIPVIIAIAVIFIIFYIVKSFTTNDETARGTAHIHVLYSVIGLFVIVSIWGLVNILVGTFGLNGNAPTQGNNVGNVPTVTNL